MMYVWHQNTSVILSWHLYNSKMSVWHINNSMVPVWHLDNSMVSVWHLKSGSTPSWRHQETVWSRSQCVNGVTGQGKSWTQARKKGSSPKSPRLQFSLRVRFSEIVTNPTTVFLLLWAKIYEFSISWGTNQKRDLGQSKSPIESN